MSSLHPPPTGLPIEEVVDAVRAALADAGAAVVEAPPGAGKTTILPLRLLDEAWLGGRRITVLEPRRVAARAAARRMAALLGEEVGKTVGYVTRDDRRVSPGTRVEVVTEGILTRRLQADPALEGVGLVVFDEFHERSVHADLGLALSIDARAGLRPDLRLLVMSATLDGGRVAELVAEPAVPVVRSSGRQHPVEVSWRPMRKGERLETAVADAVRSVLAEATGDVLVFLPGVAEIRRTASALGELGAVTAVHELHGSLPAAAQDAALAPAPIGTHKVVLATDIAETSLTVEGVEAVVDSGLARAPRFDAASGLTRLVTLPISRASAEQRAGRAGRLGPGRAVRLWSKLEHAARRLQTDAEITQVDLAALALELAAWGDARGAGLRWMDPPPARALDAAHELLTMLGAVDGQRITPLGKAMAQLPVHPRLARMVLAYRTWTACAVAALLEERDVLRGRRDEVPVDVAERVALMIDGRRRYEADGRAVERARQRAADLARRAALPVEPEGETVGEAWRSHVGPALAEAYPERVAQARPSGRGRFKLRNGRGAWVPESDPVAKVPWIVAAELAGGGGDSRVFLAAAIDESYVLERFSDGIEEHHLLQWDSERDDLVDRVARRLGGIELGTVSRRPAPGPSTTGALIDQVRRTRLAVLEPSEAARSLQHRVAFLRRHLGEPWPDLSDGALLADLSWLEAALSGATGRNELRAVEMDRILKGLVAAATPERAHLLDRLAPPSLALPGGRPVPIDYTTDPPSGAVRVQRLYGQTAHPTVGDGVPLVLHLLSPADRPIQVTADLPRFWAGTWTEVRREMAGRYPKHAWPTDPAEAEPPARR